MRLHLLPVWLWQAGLPVYIWVAVALACACLYLAFVVILLVVGRREQARAVAGFVPDCVILFKRLLGDDRISRRRKAVLGILLVYLATPIDVIPDFLPVIGQLDDAILVGLVLRAFVKGTGPEIVREHWPGPEGTLQVLLRLAGSGTQRA